MVKRNTYVANIEIENALRDQVRKALARASAKVIEPVRQKIRTTYENEAFVTSIRSGLLKADFGLTDPRASSTTSAIVEALVQQTTARFEVGTGAILGSLVIEIETGLPASVINKAHYESNGTEIPWLSWLLQEGTRIVVSDHHVKYGDLPNSRSGMALMAKDGAFRVDPAFAGTNSDNAITRFISSKAPEILELMINAILNEL